MGRPRTIGSTERSEIVDAIKAGTSRNEIARRFDRGAGTISRIALAEGLSFERTAEAASASAARSADFAQRRSILRDRFLDEAAQLLDQLHKPHVVIGWYKGVAFEHELPEPDARSKKDLAIAAGIFVDKAVRLDLADDESSFAAVDVWLRDILGSASRG
jgi:hypothetical protein